MIWFENDCTIKEVALFDAVQENENGKILLPPYQRDAVWSEGRMCALWDSLLRGFPLPSFLLVKGRGESHKLSGHQGKCELSGEPVDAYFDLLDGQQRLTSITRGITTGKTPSVRLWLDLAPPGERKSHPFKFKYWLHPCTNVFPFGFRMEAGGEHDFSPLHDEELKNIWCALQGQHPDKEFEFYEIPLDKSFPWRACCPVPLDELIALIRLTQIDDTPVDRAALAKEVKVLAKKHQETIKQYHPDWKEPQEIIIESVVSALLRIKKAKLVFQLVDLDGVEDDEEGGGYTLFERIGRGGEPITQRQLAVSKLMLILGQAGHNAVASFHKTKWGYMMETEDIIHALARIAYVVAQVKPLPVGDSPDFERRLQDWDMFDLSTEKLKAMKKDDGLWCRFKDELKELSEVGCMQKLFDSVFDKILLYHPSDNPKGFPLVQLAQGSRSGEGIAPVTLHPLLLWQFKYGNDAPIDECAVNDMLRWVLFTNGITNDPRHDKLNRSAFWEVFSVGRLNFSVLREKVFGSEPLRRELGFSFVRPKVDKDGKIESTEYIPDHLLNPKERIELAARQLLLTNSSTNAVSKFVLMWNQRAALHFMYGEIDQKYLPALHGKGRPFHLDHIIARNSFLYTKFSGIDENSLLEGTKLFFGQCSLKKAELKSDTFRKSLPNMNANYRYWPKHLNVADKDNGVCTKMNVQGVQNNLKGHPLSKKFVNAQPETIWNWSAIQNQDQQEWEALPPKEGKWDPDMVAKFISVLFRRQYYLYGTVYQFLTPSFDLDNNFSLIGIISTD